MTDREKIEEALSVVGCCLKGGYSPSLRQVEFIKHALKAGRRATLDGWERASKCRQGDG